MGESREEYNGGVTCDPIAVQCTVLKPADTDSSSTGHIHKRKSLRRRHYLIPSSQNQSLPQRPVVDAIFRRPHEIDGVSWHANDCDIK